MKRYEPVGVCIYCGARDVLRDEHIVPRALNGDWILPKASCRACEAVTSKFEAKVLRGPLWLPRINLGLRTRHPEAQPDTFPIEVTVKNRKETLPVSASKALPSIVLPMFTTPGFLRGDGVQEGIGIQGFYIGHVFRTPEEVAEALGVDRIALEMEYPVVEFARLIAKIGYGYAVGELGLDQVVEPLVLPAIRGVTQDIGHWVGSSADVGPPLDDNTLHVARIFKKDSWIVVAISLFTLQPAPIYTVLISKGATSS